MLGNIKILEIEKIKFVGKDGVWKISKSRLTPFENLEYGINIFRKHEMVIWYWIWDQYLKNT